MENGILDVLTEGIIAVDETGAVCTFNRKAREIFGIEEMSDVHYKSGKVESGDIVIIAITALGQDDGGMCSDLLKKINIIDKIAKGSSITAIGKLDKEDKAVFKVHDHSRLGTKLEMTHLYAGRRVSVQMNLEDRQIDILVDGRNYPVQYIQSFGHMVVLDGHTGKVKFVQSHGYSYRKESIGDILRGGDFREKGNKTRINLIGLPLADVLNEPEVVDALMRTASGTYKGFECKYMNIHGRPVLCSLRQVDSKSITKQGVLLVEDVSEFNMLIRERNRAIKALEDMRYKSFRDKQLDQMPEIVGQSIRMKRVKQLATSAALSKSTVLILGESGTGKNVIAQAIHKRSSVGAQPFIQVNCGALPEHLIESELFGYAGGAFSGANSKGKPGFFEMANSGTLLLDEVGEIPKHTQVKLLHAIQHNQFFRVGGTKPVQVKVRILAATNKNLEKEVEAGNFREDLYYRLNVLRIEIPPLRERTEDIRELVGALIPKVCERMGVGVKELTGDALFILQNHNYPGNVRELENVLERAINMTSGDIILPEHLMLDRLGQKQNVVVHTFENKTLREIVSAAEKAEILKVIQLEDGNRQRILQKLGIGKSSFYEKLKKHEIEYRV